MNDKLKLLSLVGKGMVKNYYDVIPLVIYVISAFF